ncbi:unnamed protein product [Adineta ricciae]|uniref:Uncharacterized protein n=1 Tax=Adineta ricciae TaxID=249248 RepID=A0A814J7R1_ADIRI|nr:unnamed protein product [Adineta ricciae]
MTMTSSKIELIKPIQRAVVSPFHIIHYYPIEDGWSSKMHDKEIIEMKYNECFFSDLGVEVRKHLEGMRDPKQELWKPFYTLMYATTAWS